MIVFPNAKINLGLHVVSKRQDGFHDLETIFAPIPFYDILEIIPHNGETLFYQSGITHNINPNENLCLKAFQLIKKRHPQVTDIEMWLHKVIPTGAGLGGGSSDAAFTLMILNKLFHLNLSTDILKNYCAVLGSDCSFFIENKTILAKGKGDDFSSLNLDLSSYKWVVIKPSFSISTAQAYSDIIPKQSNIPLQNQIHFPIDQWKNTIQNDFEDHLFVLYPELNKLKKMLYHQGALYASMSGSGSAIYGLFNKLPSLETLKDTGYIKTYQNSSLLFYQQLNTF